MILAIEANRSAKGRAIDEADSSGNKRTKHMRLVTPETRKE